MTYFEYFHSFLPKFLADLPLLLYLPNVVSSLFFLIQTCPICFSNIVLDVGLSNWTWPIYQWVHQVEILLTYILQKWHIFFSSVQLEWPQRQPLRWLQNLLKKFKRVEIAQYLLQDRCGIKYEINNKRQMKNSRTLRELKAHL